MPYGNKDMYIFKWVSKNYLIFSSIFVCVFFNVEQTNQHSIYYKPHTHNFHILLTKSDISMFRYHSQADRKLYARNSISTSNADPDFSSLVLPDQSEILNYFAGWGHWIVLPMSLKN